MSAVLKIPWIPVFSLQKKTDGTQDPLIGLIEMPAGGKLEADGAGIGPRPFRRPAGAVFHGGQAGVSGLFFPVADGQPEPVRPADRGMRFQPWQKSVVPERSGDGSRQGTADGIHGPDEGTAVHGG